MKKWAFTLVELLVVAAIIGILLSLIFPMVASSVRRGRRMQCANNLRQLTSAMIAFTTRNRGVLPRTRKSGTEYWQQAPWLGSECQWGSVVGALVSIVGDAGTFRKLVRCPALPNGVLTSGIGSNGRFDYATIEGWGGFNLGHARATANLTYDGRTETLPNPLIVEEDPWFNINHTNVDPFHGNVDRLGSWHEGYGNYGAVDGSVHAVRATFRDSAGNVLGPLAREWFVIAPSGKEISPGANYNGPYGFWNHL